MWLRFFLEAWGRFSCFLFHFLTKGFNKIVVKVKKGRTLEQSGGVSKGIGIRS